MRKNEGLGQMRMKKALGRQTDKMREGERGREREREREVTIKNCLDLDLDVRL